MATVYVETTIVSYLTARRSRDFIVRAHQELTRKWWHSRRDRYRLVISARVIDEAQCGNRAEAKKRLRLLSRLEVLAANPDLEALAENVRSELHFPEKAAVDAFHLACGIHYDVDYLLTWNCSHLANAHTLRHLADLCRREGLWLPIVCTPQEMLPGEEGL